MLLPVALARYRVDAPIDTGTFSRIYRATSLSHGRAVCLKLVRRNAFDEGLSELNRERVRAAPPATPDPPLFLSTAPRRISRYEGYPDGFSLTGYNSRAHDLTAGH